MAKTTEFGQLLVELMAVPCQETVEDVQKRLGYGEQYVDVTKRIQSQADYFWGWCTAIVRVTTRHGVGTAQLQHVNCLSAEDFADSQAFGDLVQIAIRNAEQRQWQVAH